MPIFQFESHRLMSHRIHEVLFVSSPYDLYMMEEEGLLADRISDEYTLLHLTNAPAITRVSTAQEAIEAISREHYDLVITGLRVGKEQHVSDMARAIKQIKPAMPIILLTPETGRTAQTPRRTLDAVDRVFYWHGDTRLFLAVIKNLEDLANAPHDCLSEQVRIIILVEDSPHFYSDYLPLIYTEILEQTRSLIAEGATADEKLSRMRSRPKILMASTYEEAVAIYRKYRHNVLGIISDVRFPRNDEIDPEAGFLFTQLVKQDNPDIPVLLQSQDIANAYRAGALGATYADKNSPHLLSNLRHFIKTYFGFGDFIFRMKDGTQVGMAGTLLEMEQSLAMVPDESIEYHSIRNHFSNWLFARGEFELATMLRPLKVSDFPSTFELRQIILEKLRTTRMAKRRMKIARFSERNLDLVMPFMRFGGGSIGGKGRGIGFMSKLLSDPKIAKRFQGSEVIIPQTAVIGTEVFDRFLDRNRLQEIAVTEMDDGKIASAFLRAELPADLVGEFAAFLKRIDKPLAVRSSSLSEDSLSQPFAGLYATYMLPNNHPDFEERLKQFLCAIKLVFASTFFGNPKAYMEANGISIEGEKMAVVIQQIVGKNHDHYYYPDLGGVAQSYNYFPVGYLKPEDGIAQIVMGLGTMAVRGERALRFCPRYPTILPQFLNPRDILARSQRTFHALDLQKRKPTLFLDEDVTLTTLDLSAAEQHGVLAPLGGVYSSEDEVIYEGLEREGTRVVTFSRLLSGGAYSLPDTISEMLDIGSAGMGCPVEMEFAAKLPQGQKPPVFYFLQIRPLVSGEEAEEVNVEGLSQSACIATSSKAMGNGTFADITNIIAVKPEAFDPSRSHEIAAEIGRINSHMVERGENYLLLGFGRWGTTNPMLGIPVAYAQISHAKVIVEISTPTMDVEPSQGTHFFHNITSSRIGYLSIDQSEPHDFVDWKWLNDQAAIQETTYLKHIRCPRPAITRINGRKTKGVILKPIKE